MEKDKYCMISLIWGNLKKKKKLIETEQTGGQQSFVRAGGNWVERAKRRKRAAVPQQRQEGYPRELLGLESR